MTSTDSLATDYLTITQACGLLDRSERGKLALTGPDARSFLQGQVTNDVEALRPGHGCYAAFLTPKGKMLGDLRILDTADELRLDTERVALQELFNMIRRFSIGYDVVLSKRTRECGLLSLIGPAALSVVGPIDLPEVEHANAPASVAGVDVRLIRTDVGVDLLCDAAETEALRSALTAAGAVAVSESAAEVLRIESGRPRFGIDLDESVIPQEAGLNDRAVSFTKGCYVGQETVARLYYRGKPNRFLRGLLLSGLCETGEEISLDARTVGRVGSVADSPDLGPIALALVRREAPSGSMVSIGADGVGAEVVKLPFR